MKYTLKKINLHETTLDKMLSTHTDAGYVIISASRGEFDYLENSRRSKKLQADIDSSGLSYIPVWGGFVETNAETGEKQEVKEKSYVITNFKRGSTQPLKGSEDLKELGTVLCQKYDQESFLYKPQGPSKKAFYLTASGGIDGSFSASSPTTAADVYFTNLKKARSKSKNGKSFTYREGIIYMAQSPATLYEARRRRGEMFFKF